MRQLPILRFAKVSKKYNADGVALCEVSFIIHPGEFSALAGPSGSGKTTILNIAAGLDRPTAGEVIFSGNDLGKLSKNDLSRLRKTSMGFVFQAYNLFPVLTALENVEYPLALNGVESAERIARATQALKEVGLPEFARRFPSQLSGGQQQRVAIARAMVAEPKIIFADEPTANLDSSTAEKLLRLFRKLNEEKGITFLFSSHDPMVLRNAHRVLEISDGRIKKDSAKKETKEIAHDKMVRQSLVRLPVVRSGTGKFSLWHDPLRRSPHARGKHPGGYRNGSQ